MVVPTYGPFLIGNFCEDGVHIGLVECQFTVELVQSPKHVPVGLDEIILDRLLLFIVFG